MERNRVGEELLLQAASNGIDIIIPKGKVLALPGGTTLTVKAGELWVTDRGRDIMLQRGQEYCSNNGAAQIVLANIADIPATVRIGKGEPRGCTD